MTLFQRCLLTAASYVSRIVNYSGDLTGDSERHNSPAQTFEEQLGGADNTAANIRGKQGVCRFLLSPTEVDDFGAVNAGRWCRR